MSKNHFLLQCWEFSRQDLQVIHFDDDADGIEDDVDDEHEDDSQGLEIENLAAKQILMQTKTMMQDGMQNEPKAEYITYPTSPLN